MRLRRFLVTFGVAAALIAGCQPIQPVEEGAEEGAVATATAPAVEEAEAITGTVEITDTVELTASEEITGPGEAADAEMTPEAAEEATATPEADEEATPEATEEITGSEEMTETEQITGTEEMTGTQGRILPGLVIQEFVAVAVEYTFTAPETIPAGWTRVVLENDGQEQRDIVLLKVEGERSVDDLLAVLADPEAPVPEWVELYGGTLVEPGGRNSYLVNLTPGDYIYFSFGQGELSAAAQGMIGTLTVTEAGGAAETIELPEADVSVNLVDYSFIISNTTGSPDTLPAGEQIFYVENTGTEPHHLIIFRIQEGYTFEDVLPFLSGEAAPGATEPPVEEAGYSGELSPGVELYFSQALTPGNYFFICFIPSAENEGAPHFALGMVRQVTVE